jgi:hypothetical protein
LDILGLVGLSLNWRIIELLELGSEVIVRHHNLMWVAVVDLDAIDFPGAAVTVWTGPRVWVSYKQDVRWAATKGDSTLSQQGRREA